MNQVWSWILAVIGLSGVFLAGNSRKLGWAIGVGVQVLWLAYAITTRQWGFLVSAVGYGGIYGRNWLVWRRQERERAAREIGPKPVTTPDGGREADLPDWEREFLETQDAAEARIAAASRASAETYFGDKVTGGIVRNPVRVDDWSPPGLVAPVVERLNADTAECMEGAPGIVGDHHDGCPCRKTGRHRIHRCEHGTEWWSDVPDPAATRAQVVDQFRRALLDGLEDLDRDDHWGTLVRPGDVADLIEAVAAEVGRG